jgi:hypothetical protein
MSNLITEAFVSQFRTNVTFLYQQRGSKLRGRVREEASNARYIFFDRIGPTTAVKKTVRHGDTPLVNTQHSRRRAEKVDYEWADLIDKEDETRILIEPRSAYAQNAAFAMGRAFDDEVILAFTADAKEGESGGTTVAFPSAQIIVNGGTGMTLDKLKSAKLLFDRADVPMENWQLVVSPDAVIDLLGDPEVTSSDFNVIKTLVSGDMEGLTYMNFHWVKSTRLPITGNIRKCFAWHPDAMGMIVGMEFTTRITERDDKSYSTQVYVAGSFGGVRILDNGVVEIDIDESV